MCGRYYWLNTKENSLSLEFKEKTLDFLTHKCFAQDQVEEDFIQRMTEQKYSPANLQEEVSKCLNLTADEQHQLLQLLRKYASLFDRSLGTWKTSPVELELKEGAKPYHARPYQVPRINYEKLKRETERLCQVGVLKKVNRSEWAAPMKLSLMIRSSLG